MRKFKGDGNILICWEHGRLTDIANAIGIGNAPKYPKERYAWLARSLPRPLRRVIVVLHLNFPCVLHEYPHVLKSCPLTIQPSPSRFDIIWTVDDPYDQINNITSELCSELDDAFINDKWVQTDGAWAQQIV